MTPQMQRAYDFIVSEMDERGYSPSVREIMAHLGLNAISAAHRVVSQLVDRGLLVRIPGKSRALYLPGDTRTLAAHPAWDRLRWALDAGNYDAADAALAQLERARVVA
jgi:SOS-response transcriptional repressor LexA